jgi:hypothetical protein
MKNFVFRGTLFLVALAVAACSSRSYPESGSGGDIIVVDESRAVVGPSEGRGPGFIPPGHYPPRGECRIWYAGRPPGQQPPPQPCGRLEGRLPLGSWLLFDGKHWDTRDDWRERERRRPDSVPGVVLRLMADLVDDG